MRDKLFDKISSFFLNYIYSWQWLSYRKSLKELHDQMSQECKRLDEEEKKYGKPQKPSDYDPWRDNSDDLYEIEEKIRLLKTRYILKKVDKTIFCLPEPSEKSDLWEKANLIGRWLLTEKGFSKASILIRRNRKELLEYIVVLVGLIGALTGLVAVFKD